MFAFRTTRRPLREAHLQSRALLAGMLAPWLFCWTNWAERATHKITFISSHFFVNRSSSYFPPTSSFLLGYDLNIFLDHAKERGE